VTRRIAAAVAALVAIATVLVAVGVGQGSPPKSVTLSAAQSAQEIKTIDGAGPAVMRGRELFASHGCGACHTIASANANGKLGPQLDAILAGESSSAIEQQITHPPDTLPPFQDGLMPRDFGTRLPSADIQSLATFVAAAAAAAHGK
jgi:mono/diheme cytochrome c family protein